MSKNEYKKYRSFKRIMEDLFGKDAWYALKESNHIPTWRKWCTKALNAIHNSISETVKVSDDEWQEQVNFIIDSGLDCLKEADEVDELISILAATILELSFHQVGFIPRRRGSEHARAFRKGSCDLSGFRSVIYVQNNEQKEKQFWHQQQREIGFQNQLDLYAEYKKVGGSMLYADWCKSQSAE